MRLIVIHLVLVTAVGGAVSASRSQAAQTNSPASEDQKAVLKNSKDPEELTQALIKVGRSSPVAGKGLVDYLTNSEFLTRLDPASEPVPDRDDRLQRVLYVIAASPPEVSNSAFLQLMRDKRFGSDPDRIETLLVTVHCRQTGAAEITRVW